MSTLHPRECDKCRKFVPQSSCIHEFEWELREQIAKEIEAAMRDTKVFDTLNNARNTGLRRAAFIARSGDDNG